MKTMFATSWALAALALCKGVVATGDLDAFHRASRVFSDPQQLFDPVVRADARGSVAVASGDNCSVHLETYLLGLQNKQLWAMQMFDASTKVPEGVLVGNLVQLGNYDECLAVKGVESSSGLFDGQHCLIAITLEKTNTPSEAEVTWERAQQLVATDLTAAVGQVVDALHGLSLQVALCVPSSCSAGELQAALQLSVSEQNITVTVDPDQCHTSSRRPRLRAIDWAAIAILGFFVCLAVASTLYDIRTMMTGAPRSPLLLAFSVYSNWLRLISINNSGDTLTALHGIRFISMGWVVLGHRYLVNGGLPAVNKIYLEDFKKDWSRLTIMNATLSVDTFFLLSGLLASYLFLKEVERRGRFDVLLFYVHRYIRLTPALAVMVLMTVTLLNYGSEGPLWDSRNRVYRENCENNWWSNLLYINNYYDPGHMCLGQTWYLAVDMQLHWLSPLVLVPLWKRPRLAQFLLAVLIVAGWAVAFTVPYVEQYWAGVWTGPVELRAVSQQKNYYPTYTRFMPWLMGIALGHWLRVAKKNKLKLSPGTVVAGWVFCTVLTIGAVHLAYPFQQPEYVYDRVESSLFISLFRPAWALGVAWIIFACDLGHGGVPNTVLSWKLFQPLGRLSYGIYLTHVSVLIVLTAGIKTPMYLADANSIPQFMGDLLISIGWAIALTLLFESPIILLEKMLLGPKGGGNARTTPAAAVPTVGGQLEKGAV